MRVVVTVSIFVLIIISSYNMVYAESSFQMTGSGAAVVTDQNPTLSKSTLSLVLSDPSTISNGSVLIYGSNLHLHAHVLPQKWSISYTSGGSFYGKGMIQTSSGQTLNMTLDGKRIFATNTGSLWRVGADLEENNTSLVLEYLLTGTDPIPAVNVSPIQTVIIPNGNSGMNHKGFFIPLNAEVIRGTTVTWENHDNIGHVIQSEDSQGNVIALFNSGILKTGDTFSYKFTKPGTYYYFDTLHPWRIGIITVI